MARKLLPLSSSGPAIRAGLISPPLLTANLPMRRFKPSITSEALSARTFGHLPESQMSPISKWMFSKCI